MKITNKTDFFLWMKEYSGLDCFSLRGYEITKEEEISMSLVYITEKRFIRLYISFNINNPINLKIKFNPQDYQGYNDNLFNMLYNRIAEWSASLKDRYIIHQLSI